MPVVAVLQVARARSISSAVASVDADWPPEDMSLLRFLVTALSAALAMIVDLQGLRQQNKGALAAVRRAHEEVRLAQTRVSDFEVVAQYRDLLINGHCLRSILLQMKDAYASYESLAVRVEHERAVSADLVKLTEAVSDELNGSSL